MSDDLQRMEQASAAKRMNLAEWRKSRVHELTLPSGLAVQVRDVTMTDIALSGEMPNTLLDLFLDETEDITKMPESKQVRQMLESGKEFAALLDLIASECLVDPQIGEAADEQHITLAELPQADKMEIFNWANREATNARPFREGEAQSVDAA